MSERKITFAELKAIILAQLDVASFYSRYIDSKYALVQDSSEGWSNRVNCPICRGGMSTGCFFVNLNDAKFQCHSCGKGGSVFDFWMHMNGMQIGDKTGFRQAMEEIAKAANVNIEALKKGTSQEPKSYPVSTGKSILATTPSSAENELPLYINKADEYDKANQPIEDAVIRRMQAALRPDHVEYLNLVRGFTKKTIDELKIGWDETSGGKDADTGKWYYGRYSFPVPDKNEFIRNVRLYSNRCDPGFKMINYTTGKKPMQKKYGSPIRLLGLHKLMKGGYSNVVLVGGEFKWGLLNQKFEAAGMQSWYAVTGTGGENKFLGEWLEPMYGKNVYICLDCDDPGKSAAANIVNRFFLAPLQKGKFQSVHIVTLPLDGSKDSKDITDYFISSKNEIDDFLRLCTNTPEVIPGGLNHDDASVEAIDVSDFGTAVKDRRYIDQRITVPLTISGASSKVYHAIRSYRVARCPLMENGECCQKEQEECTIPYGHSLFIESCMQKEGEVLKSLGRMACQKEQGDKVRVRAVEKVVMEQHFAHQVIDRLKIEEDDEGHSKNSQELIQTAVYVLQPPTSISIEYQNYQATGWIRTHPKTSAATFFIESLVPLDEDWKKFTMESPESRSLIQTIKTDFTVDQIIHDITQGVTKIYETDEILYAVLLTYLSPIRFVFNESPIRGWINAAVIGDSGMGKSRTYTRFADWINVGDTFSALSGKRTGLLYSLKQKNEEWFVSVGRYVQCCYKILCIDETQEMLPSEIKKMAMAMDEGHLKVDQVASGCFNTRTRTFFTLNPQLREGVAATISDFVNGCEALRRSFDPMFIRRLDLAVFVSGKRKHEFYNQFVDAQKVKEAPMRLTAKMMKALVFWAWTRKPKQIIWTSEGTHECLKSAIELSKIFGDADQIPLVNPQDFRENLARLSVAYAILSRNFTEDLQSVRVEPLHVKAIHEFVYMVYTSSACNLHHHSAQTRQRTSLDDFDRIKISIQDMISQQESSGNPLFRDANPFLQLLLLIQQLGNVKQGDLADTIGVSRNWIQRRLAMIQGFNLIEQTERGFKSTRKLNLFMQQWRTDPKVDKMLQTVNENRGKAAMLAKDDIPYDPATYEPAITYTDPFS